MIMTNVKFHLVSLGCPKNQVDSEVMAALLKKGGYEPTSMPENAHVILINTCAFILPAKQEAIEEILRMAEWKKQGACRKLVVTGCLPQRYGRILEKELPEVDLFLGTGEIPQIVKLIRQSGGKTVIGKPRFLMNAGFPRMIAPSVRTAYLKIAEGCSNRCSYCIIPQIRGPFRSRTPDDLLLEAARLAADGIWELILIAQDTTAYGRDLQGKPSLSQLIRELASLKGLQWIRLLYAHPFSLSDDLLKTMAAEEKICRYLDLPVQHVTDLILAAMNRKSNRSTITETPARVRRLIPGVALRTSIIVGFPGETAKQFDELLRFVEETRFENLGVFTYSREEGTAAADLPRQVSEKVKQKRHDLLMETQAEISFEINQARIGSQEDVLLEGENDLPECSADYPLQGRIRAQAPEIDGLTYVKTKKGKVGDIVRCKITAADIYDLYAEEI
jgi:ribosomal protein S12 methylthiotransferase